MGRTEKPSTQEAACEKAQRTEDGRVVEGSAGAFSAEGGQLSQQWEAGAVLPPSFGFFLQQQTEQFLHSQFHLDSVGTF